MAILCNMYILQVSNTEWQYLATVARSHEEANMCDINATYEWVPVPIQRNNIDIDPCVQGLSGLSSDLNSTRMCSWSMQRKEYVDLTKEDTQYHPTLRTNFSANNSMNMMNTRLITQRSWSLSFLSNQY
eukprot:64248_1